MTSIHFPNPVKARTRDRVIGGLLDFVDFKEYKSMPGYYLIQIKPQILSYVTKHLFDRPKEGGLKGFSTVSEEEFNELLNQIKQRAEERKELLNELSEHGEAITRLLAESPSVQTYSTSKEIIGSQKVGRDYLSDIRFISNICTSRSFPTTVDDVTSISQKLDSAGGIFDSICRHIRHLLEDAKTAESIDPEEVEELRQEYEESRNNLNWCIETKKLDRPGNEEEFYDAIIRGQGDVDTFEEDMEYYKTETQRLKQQLNDAKKPSALYGLKFIVRGLKHVANECVKWFEDEQEGESAKEDFLARIKESGGDSVESAGGPSASGTTKEDEQLKRPNALLALLNTFDGKMRNDAKETFLLFLAQQLEGGDLNDLVKLCKKVLFIVSELSADVANVRLRLDFEAATIQVGVQMFDPIRAINDEKRKASAANVPFFHHLLPLSAGIPNFEEAAYVGAPSHEFPTADEIQVLNEINNMIVCNAKVSKTSVEVISGKNYVKRTGARETQCVGFLYKPQFMIQAYARSQGNTVEAEPYMGAPGSLPSLTGNVGDYLEHSTAFRERRRGHVYCIFYYGTAPYAADQDDVYPLDRVFGHGLLDPYTQEALLYAWDLSKVNLRPGVENRDENFSKSTHCEYTYLTVSLRRPDDVFYDKMREVPYDIMILQSNIFPQLVFGKKLVHMPEIKREYVKGGNFQGDKGMTIEYNDRIWTRKFTRNPALEVFDEKTRSDTIFCSKLQFAIEVVTSPSLRIRDVAARLRKLRSSAITYNQYELRLSDDRGKLDVVRENLHNPFLDHYMLKPPTKLDNTGRKLVKQALRDIAYTLFCKMHEGFCDKKLYDLTAAINSVSSTFRKYRFMRLMMRRVTKETVGSPMLYTLDGISIPCDIIGIEDGMLLLSPREASVRRRIALTDKKEIDLYYTCLINFTERINTFDFDPTEIEPEKFAKCKAIIERMSFDDNLKAQVIEYALKKTSTKLDSDQVSLFVRSFRDEEAKFKPGSNISSQNLTTLSVTTNYGLVPKIVEGTLKIIDTVFGTRSSCTLPITVRGTIEERPDCIEEKVIDEPFVGNMDMTFLTLLDHEMYQGTNKLMIGLFNFYHGYDSPGFTPSKLGAFLWEELIDKDWDDATLNRVLFLISRQEKNLILRSAQRITTKDERHNEKPVMIVRRKIDFVGDE